MQVSRGSIDRYPLTRIIIREINIICNNVMILILCDWLVLSAFIQCCIRIVSTHLNPESPKINWTNYDVLITDELDCINLNGHKVVENYCFDEGNDCNNNKLLSIVSHKNNNAYRYSLYLNYSHYRFNIIIYYLP